MLPDAVGIYQVNARNANANRHPLAPLARRLEERELQRRVGIHNFSDMSRLLALASPDIVDLLRINTVVRGTSSALGMTMVERVRIFSAIAHRGLPPRGSRLPHVHR